MTYSQKAQHIVQTVIRNTEDVVPGAFETFSFVEKVAWIGEVLEQHHIYVSRSCAYAILKAVVWPKVGE